MTPLMALKALGVSILVFYGQTVLFAVLSYGVLHLIYGSVNVSLATWIAIISVAFTFAFIPSLLRHIKEIRRSIRERSRG